MDVSQPSSQPKRSNFNSVGDFLKNYWRDYTFLFLIGAVIIGLDQWTKALVRTNISLGSDWLPAKLTWLMPYARVRYWYNSGAAFGIFQNGNLVFTILAIIVILLILYFFPRTTNEGWWLRLAMAMQLAGAGGNLIDRLRFSHVTDFISVGNFAIFNVSDASISVGVAVLILGVWFKERMDKKRAAAASLTEDEAKDE
jgi:signal peptidase II